MYYTSPILYQLQKVVGMTVTDINRKGVPTAVKRQPVGSVHAYWSDESGATSSWSPG